jgi:hypothetical protein
MDTAVIANQKPPDPPDPALKARRLARVHEPRRKPGKLVIKTLDQLDLRTNAAKKVRQLISIWENELGGADNMTESLRQLIQRAALLSVLIESSEAEWLAGGALAESTYFTAINSQRRILLALGLDRRSRDISLTLSDYLRETDVDVEETDEVSP